MSRLCAVYLSLLLEFLLGRTELVDRPRKQRAQRQGFVEVPSTTIGVECRLQQPHFLSLRHAASWPSPPWLLVEEATARLGCSCPYGSKIFCLAGITNGHFVNNNGERATRTRSTEEGTGKQVRCCLEFLYIGPCHLGTSAGRASNYALDTSLTITLPFIFLFSSRAPTV